MHTQTRPPGPHPLLLQAALAFRRSPHLTLARLTRQYGDLVSLNLRSGTVYLSGHPQHLQQLEVGASRSTEIQPGLTAELVLAAALTWCSGHLHQSPELVLADPRALLAESLRLYPPAWLQQIPLEGSCRLGAYDLPAGSRMWINAWGWQHDARFYPAPAEFRPVRWEAPQRLPATYLPCGVGAQARMLLDQVLCTGEKILPVLIDSGRMPSPETVHPVCRIGAWLLPAPLLYDPGKLATWLTG